MIFPLRGGLAPLTLASGKPFAPSDLANLALWLKADALTLNDGDAVSSWTDSSGNNRHYTQSGAASLKPTYKANIINTKPCLLFDGGDKLTRTGWLSDTNYTVFVVGYRTGGSTGGAFFSGDASFQLDVRADLTQMKTGGVTVGSYTVTVPKIITAQRAATSSVWINGALNESKLTAVDVCDSTISTVGNRNDNALPLTGYIAEIIVYNTLLGDTDRGSVQTYLATKYGITLA